MNYSIMKAIDNISSIKAEALFYIMEGDIELVGEDLLACMVFKKGQDLQAFYDLFSPEVRVTIVSLTKVFNDPDTYVDEDLLIYKDKNGIYRKYITFGNINNYILKAVTNTAYEISQDYNYFNIDVCNSNGVLSTERVYKLNLCLKRYKWYREESI